jgi:hypothetical protein
MIHLYFWIFSMYKHLICQLYNCGIDEEHFKVQTLGQFQGSIIKLEIGSAARIGH